MTNRHPIIRLPCTPLSSPPATWSRSKSARLRAVQGRLSA